MLDTFFLAQIIGVYLVIAGVSGLLYPGRMMKALKEYTRSSLLPYFDAVLALLLGLVVVLTHNVWDTLEAGIVSAFGWIALIEGLALFLLPEDTVKSLTKWFTDPAIMKGVMLVTTAAGAYLVYFSFFA